jgi:hypothetical protein
VQGGGGGGAGAGCVTLCALPPTVIVPVRLAVVVFAAATYVTVAEPLPLALPAASVIHGTSLDAVHGHPAPAVRAIVAVSPAAATVRAGGEMS